MFTNFPEQWQDLLKEKGITTETAIQKELFAPITEGDNVLGISPTGTGKTLAYLLPLLRTLKPKKAQQLLILAPNSELAGQIFDVTKQWAEPLGITAQLFLSGSSQKRQIERLKKGPEILIGTPGRVFELIKLKKIKMMNVNTIVLDEFDELLSDSQYHFVTKISHHVPRDHQMIYISANAQFLSEKLAELGIDVYFHTAVGQMAWIFVGVTLFLGVILALITKIVYPLFTQVFEAYDNLNNSIKENITPKN